MALSAFLFFDIEKSFPVPQSEAYVVLLKKMLLRLNISELLILSLEQKVTFYIYSEANMPNFEQVSTLIKECLPVHGLKPKNETILDDQNAVDHFLRTTNGLNHSQDHIEQLKQFSAAYHIAKKNNTIGPVFQNLYQRSIWLHEKVRMKTSYFKTALTIPGIFAELAQKIYESFSQLTVCMADSSALAINIAQMLYLHGCRKFLFWGSEEAYKKLKKQSTFPLSRCENKNQATIDILILDENESVDLAEQAVANRQEQKNNLPLLILSKSSAFKKKQFSRTFYNTYFYNYADLERVIDKNRNERDKQRNEIIPWIENEIVNFFNWLSGDAQNRFVEIIGQSPKMQEIFELISRISQNDITVLIEGESGTGKELVSHAIHKLSGRSEKPFIVVNCGAIPENLIESELFGHIRGAFTGAVSNKNGLFYEANQGTLFLDEIGELPPQLQVKLLRVLQEGEVKPVGSNETIKVDVRVLAATNRSLKQMVESGQFRSDLYYRLNVILIALPALKQRHEDIILLAEHFLKKFNNRLNKEVRSFAPEVIEMLKAYSWPGNIRELENVIEHAVALAMGNEVLIYDLPAHIQPSEATIVNNFEPKTLKELEKEHIINVLNKVNGEHEKACEVLGIGRTTLWRKLKEYHLQDSSSDFQNEN